MTYSFHGWQQRAGSNYLRHPSRYSEAWRLHCAMGKRRLPPRGGRRCRGDKLRGGAPGEKPPVLVLSDVQTLQVDIVLAPHRSLLWKTSYHLGAPDSRLMPRRAKSDMLLLGIADGLLLANVSYQYR